MVITDFTIFANANCDTREGSQTCTRYLKGTIDQGIMYNGNLGMRLELWSDANWGGEEGRESVSRFVGTLAGGAVTYSSKKQGSAALSTGTESEYMALLHALKELIWLHPTKSAMTSMIRTSSIATTKAPSPLRTIPSTVHVQSISTSNITSLGNVLKMEQCNWNNVRQKT